MFNYFATINPTIVAVKRRGKRGVGGGEFQTNWFLTDPKHLMLVINLV